MTVLKQAEYSRWLAYQKFGIYWVAATSITRAWLSFRYVIQEVLLSDTRTCSVGTSMAVFFSGRGNAVHAVRARRYPVFSGDFPRS